MQNQKRGHGHLESKDLLDCVLDSLPILVGVLDKDGRYLYANRTYSKWFGLENDKIVGCTMTEVFGEKVYRTAEPHILEALQGATVAYEHDAIFERVGQRILNVVYQPFRRSQSEVNCVLALVTDVTQLKIKEREAMALSERLQATYENSPVGLIELDTNLMITAANHGFCEMMEYPINEIIGKSIIDLSLPADVIKSKQLQAAANDALRTGPAPRIEKRYVTKSGRVFWGAATARTLTDDGKIIKYYSCVEDVTRLKVAEAERDVIQKQIEDQNVMLAQSAKMVALGEMAAGIAHEINNPLAIIVGKASQIRRILSVLDPADFEKIMAHLNQIEATGQRISNIIKGLQTFSRDSSRDDFQLTSCQGIVVDALGLCQERFRVHGVALRVLNDVSCDINGRSTQIVQVLTNLLGNAFDAVVEKPQPWVEIATSIANDQVVFAVTDSGRGIPEAVVAKMMQPFFTTKAVGKGTGLGLSISHGIVKEHGGELSYDSTSPNTRFVLKFPLFVEDKRREVS